MSMQERLTQVGWIASRNPRKTLIMVSLMLTLLLFAVDPALADDEFEEYNIGIKTSGGSSD